MCSTETTRSDPSIQAHFKALKSREKQIHKESSSHLIPHIQRARHSYWELVLSLGNYLRQQFRERSRLWAGGPLLGYHWLPSHNHHHLETDPRLSKHCTSFVLFQSWLPAPSAACPTSTQNLLLNDKALVSFFSCYPGIVTLSCPCSCSPSLLPFLLLSTLKGWSNCLPLLPNTRGEMGAG